jgi:AcrR family transcriptional regulator
LRPRKSPAQARSRETVAAILRGAAQVFSRHGYAAGTTNRIAERAGVSIGSLYEYFPNKDALLVALMVEHVREGEALLLRTRADLGPGPHALRDVVHRFVTAMVALHDRDAALHRVLFEQTPLPRPIRDLLEAVEARITQFLVTMLARYPEVRLRHPERTARLVVQVVEALTHRHVLETHHDDDQAFVDEVVTLVLAYLTACR